MKQNIKSNRILAVVVLIIMCMMSTVINFAMSIIGTSKANIDVQDSQQSIYS